ncbi:hypothetical protein AbraIFM66951_003576 [Aspergillus brasiliensis]|nr:hypothetical protein AbraIFM66951_003576 [Aspergillus brasiliensis]
MLLCQAETTFDFIYTFGGVDNGDRWCYENKKLFEYLPKPIAQSLSTRKDLRIGFCMLWKHLASCIRNNMLPTEENVVRLIRDANEWPPHSRNFIQKGAAISSVATMLFKRAMVLEKLHFSEYDDNTNQSRFPACRNDREFGIVSALCGYETITRIQKRTMQGRKIRY